MKNDKNLSTVSILVLKKNIGYKLQYDNIVGIFSSDGEICGISDRNAIKENPL